MRANRIVVAFSLAAAFSLALPMAGCKDKGRKQGAKPAATHVASAKKTAEPASTRSSSSTSSPSMCCCLASGVASFVEEPTCKKDMGGTCVAANRCPK